MRDHHLVVEPSMFFFFFLIFNWVDLYYIFF